MSPLCHNGFLRVLAALVLLLFVGDLLADSVETLCEMRCATESSQSAQDHDQGPCQCICAAHIGAVIASDFSISIEADAHPTSFLSGEDDSRPPRLAASIDHPPQLS
jgi:hypothetical protein